MTVVRINIVVMMMIWIMSLCIRNTAGSTHQHAHIMKPRVPPVHFSLDENPEILNGEIKTLGQLGRVQDKLVEGMDHIASINQELGQFVSGITEETTKKQHLDNLVENNEAWTSNLVRSIKMGIETINIVKVYAKNKQEPPITVTASLNKIKMNTRDIAQSSLHLWIHNSRRLIDSTKRHFPQLYTQHRGLIASAEERLDELDDALSASLSKDSLRLIYDNAKEIKHFHRKMAEEATIFAETVSDLSDSNSDLEMEVSEKQSGGICLVEKNPFEEGNSGRKMVKQDYLDHARLHMGYSQGWDSVFMAVSAVLLLAAAASIGACG